MEANKIGIRVINDIHDYYYYSYGDCIYNNDIIKDRNINYKRYGIKLWKRTR